MGEMIERVARAIDPVLWKNLDRAISEGWPTDIVAMARFATTDSCLRARAAIEAMREPTVAMLDVAVASPADAIPRWRGMIDAALKE